MPTIAKLDPTSQVCEYARQTGARLADRQADRFNETARRSLTHYRLIQGRYEEAAETCSMAAFRSEAYAEEDPGFACLVVGFLAGAASVDPDPTWQAMAKSYVDCCGGISDMLREQSALGYQAQMRKRRASFEAAGLPSFPATTP